MKTLTVLLAMLAMASLLQAAVPASVLFSDSYDRANNTDLDAATSGMSGSLAPLLYQEVFEGSGQPSSIQVSGNQLNIAVGAGMSSLYLDHNFTDAAILAADGFSVSLDVTGITSADDTGNRFGGFGVGLTAAEAAAARDSFDAPATSLRPALHLAGSGVADFYADLALDQNVRLWNNGTLLNTIGVGAVTGTIRVDFLCADFNAGSQVTAVVYFNGEQIDMQTFAWDHANANYIGISGRTAGAGVFLDNLSVSTAYENRAHAPSPADGATLVNAAGLTLGWARGKDASGSPDPAIGQFYVYYNTDEPNFLDVNPVTVTDTAYTGGSFTSDQLYYWRVDESVNGSGPADANTITGYVWSFDTYTFPIIETDPAVVVVFPGAEGTLECEFTSVTAPTVTWFREAGETDVEMVNGGDVATDVFDLGGGAYRAALTISNVEAADESQYYCVIENAGGEQNTVTSAAGVLGVGRKVAHWTFNVADLQNGQYVDISGEGRHADPNVIPGAGAFGPGADTETGDALNLAANPLAAGDSGDWTPYELTGQMTLSAWINWSGTNNLFQGLMTKRDFDNGGLTGWFWEIGPAGGMNFGAQAGTTQMSVAAPAVEAGQWTHVAVTVGPDGGTIYINGEAAASNANIALTDVEAPIFVGANNRKSGTLVGLFNGWIDDARIYNYAKTQQEIVDLYYDVLQVPVCLNLDGVNLRFDVAGSGPDGRDPDCRVSLADFAAFAADWLNCGLYPTCP